MNIQKNYFEQLSVKDISLKGWAYKQLRIQADGLSGALPEFWPDIKDSAYIGGDREGWERVPYWLDGYIPMAFLLNDSKLIQTATFYIEEIIKRQRPDGWLVPESHDHYDMWGYILLCKVFTVWYDMTGDFRVEDILYRAFKAFDRHLDGTPLVDWGKMRWFEFLIPALWLYERRPEEWIAKLICKVRCCGFNWLEFVNSSDWPYKIEGPEPWRWEYYNHVVNTAMSIKIGGLLYSITGDKKYIDETEKMQAVLDKYHGQATGMMSGDETLRGTNPVRGTELCAVVEYMYSLETMYNITGDIKWADRLERVAFNALPASISPDMMSHQYDQQVNQIKCGEFSDHPWGTNDGKSNMFGVEPNYGCCTANFSQGWPKFFMNSVLRYKGKSESDEGLAISSYIPCDITTDVRGLQVRVSVDGMYPFRDTVKITVAPSSPFSFPLYLRIPGWVDSAEITADGRKYFAPRGKFYKLEGTWEGTTVITVSLKSSFKLESRPSGWYVLNRGPLLYSMPVDERWIPAEKSMYSAPYLDYSVIPVSDWKYAFCGWSSSSFPVEIKENDMDVDYIFSPETPPVEIRVNARKLEWSEIKNSAGIPDLTKLGEEEKIKMIPYGCTNLRMTEMPLVKPIVVKTED